MDGDRDVASPGKSRLLNALANTLLVLAPLLLLEGAFRLLPVSHPPYLLPVTAEHPVVRFQPNVDYLWSRDWNFSIVTRRRSNNYGYMHFADYHPQERTPLMMVIGDSFVEAHVVDAGQSFPERLHAALGGKGRVYSLGASGAPLSQYLVFADYARRTFRPDAMVFVIIGNDFDESLLEYNAAPRFHYFAERGGDFSLQRVDYELSPLKKVLRHSALIRYVVLNLSAGERLSELLRRLRGSAPAPGGPTGEALERRVADSKRAVDFFLDELPARTGLEARSILLVVDADRPAMYGDRALAEADRRYYPRMRRYLMAQAATRGFQLLDTQPAFVRRHRLDGARFEAAPTDSHWNALGHRLVAAEVRSSALFTRVFGPAEPLKP